MFFQRVRGIAVQMGELTEEPMGETEKKRWKIISLTSLTCKCCHTGVPHRGLKPKSGGSSGCHLLDSSPLLPCPYPCFVLPIKLHPSNCILGRNKNQQTKEQAKGITPTKRKETRSEEIRPSQRARGDKSPAPIFLLRYHKRKRMWQEVPSPIPLAAPEGSSQKSPPQCACCRSGQ